MQLYHFPLPAYETIQTVLSKTQLVDFSAFRSTALQKENIWVIVLTGGESERRDTEYTSKIKNMHPPKALVLILQKDN